VAVIGVIAATVGTVAVAEANVAASVVIVAGAEIVPRAVALTDRLADLRVPLARVDQPRLAARGSDQRLRAPRRVARHVHVHRPPRRRPPTRA